MIVCLSVKPVGEPDAGNPPVRFDEREVETEHGMRLLRHRRGNPDPEYVEAYPTAPPLDSTLPRRVSRILPNKCAIQFIWPSHRAQYMRLSPLSPSTAERCKRKDDIRKR
jgi:hypothetical protein